jgi:hypothetical protein
MVIMDLGDTLGLKDTGQALSSSGMRVASGFTKPVLDPGSGGASTELMNFILDKTKEGETFRLTKSHFKTFGTALGTNASGEMQHLRLSPGMNYIEVGTKLIDAYGKKQIHVTGPYVSNIAEGSKIFSTLFKGTLITLTDEQIRKTAANLGFGRSFMKKLGVSSKDAVVVSGEMLKIEWVRSEDL